MAQHNPDKLLSGKYETDEIEQALEALPPEFQEAVRQGILRVREQKLHEHQAMKCQLAIADFAISLHIHMADQETQAWYVDGVTWWYRLEGAVEDLVHNAPKAPDVSIPDSVKKAAAFIYAYSHFGSSATREAVDEKLIPFGYSTERIIENYEDEEQAEVEAMMMPSGDNNLFDKLTDEDVAAVRRDVQAIGYKLPDLGSDGGYGYDKEEEAENRIIPTLAMLPE